MQQVLPEEERFFFSFLFPFDLEERAELLSDDELFCSMVRMECIVVALLVSNRASMSVFSSASSR